ncbi:NAD(P)-binding domain-containing protein [Luteolibacter sp. SL250]|uniref:NAD(P)H-dependent glycerol-3-phosphate dehydrogenase n=1 Tax=Luteolibacter sp. SL250 TaxID=2995170 RepID=UPI002271ED6E|nr:NAD(P)-binding domain-containing protein [Luteolibacter sp. SL250]WAC21493.1 NAD(P)-binding domain-containing protein [Luteolibacter sp. SL250]
MNQRIAILGAGNMGSALAHALASQGAAVSIWDHFPETIAEIISDRTNRRYLPGIDLHPAIQPHTSAAECMDGVRLVILCLPSIFVEGVLLPLLPSLRADAILLNVAKGFAPDGKTILPAWLHTIAPGHDCAHLAGPALADEIAGGCPTFVTIAARHSTTAEETAAIIRGDILIPGTTTDLEGAVLAGILKNSYAIFLGLLERLCGQGHNLSASAMTLCSMEMERLLTAMDARPETVRGLPGMGDLTATGCSPRSHNRRLGQDLAAGLPPEGLHRRDVHVPEGVRATITFLQAARDRRVEAPILSAVAAILRGTLPPTPSTLLDALRAAAGTG